VNFIRASYIFVLSVIAVLYLWSAWGGIVHAATLPDLLATPGATNPAVTQDTIGATVCRPGWTKTVRPRAAKTDKIKDVLLLSETDREASHYELDHLVSLQLGGAPDDPKNLWLEPYAGACGARVKDVLETNLKRRVCAGTMSLDQAQAAIRTDWVTAYNRYVGRLVCDEPLSPGFSGALP